MISETECDIYGTQNCNCPAYEHWYKNKKSAYDIKLPISIEKHRPAVTEIKHETSDIELGLSNLNIKMKEILKPSEYKFYVLMYIQKKREEEVSKILGFKTTERGRKAGYTRIRQLKEIVIKKAKKLIYSGEIDF